MLRERVVPTHVGAEDILLELGSLRLGGSRLLSLVCGLVLGVQLWSAAATAPAAVRVTLAGVCLLAGLAGALWTIDGRSPWVWLVIVLRYARRPRRAVWRITPTPMPPRPQAVWQEVTPPVAWMTDQERVP